MVEYKKFPIFIFGCQRSGTSILRRVLDSHSNIACPPETGFLVQLSKIYEIKRVLNCVNSLGFTDQNVLDEMKHFTSYFLENYCLKKGKKRWAEKTPHYVNHMETIDKMFNRDVVYIGIIRNGMDVAYSLCQYNWSILDDYLNNGYEKPVAAIKFWKKQTEKIINFKNKIAKDRMFLINFEELTNTPNIILPQIFDFLDERWENSILDYSSFEHDKGFEDPEVDNFEKIIPNSNIYKNWTLEIQNSVYSEEKSFLNKLGYFV
jgi:hypothetical protein